MEYNASHPANTQVKKRKVGRPRKSEVRLTEESKMSESEKMWENRFDEYLKKYNAIRYDWVNDTAKGRVKYTNSDFYNKGISLCLGSWMPENLGGIAFDIINNIPTVSYNFEYKTSTPISMMAYMFAPNMACQGVDSVLQQINLRYGMPVDDMGKKDVIVYNKKMLAKEVFERKHDNIHLVFPRQNASMGEKFIFYREMDWYFSVLKRFLYQKARRAVYGAFAGILNPDKFLDK